MQLNNLNSNAFLDEDFKFALVFVITEVIFKI